MTAVIRVAEERDAAAVRAVYAPYCESTVISFEFEPPSEEEMLRRLRSIAGRLPWLVCEVDSRVAGYACATPHKERAAYGWSVDVAIYVDRHSHRMRIGRGLYSSLLDILARQGYRKAYAGITLPNEGSVGIHQAFGFELVGVYRGVGWKFGRWHDVAWWQRPLLPEVETPPPPIPLAEMDSDAIQEALQAGARIVRPRTAKAGA